MSFQLQTAKSNFRAKIQTGFLFLAVGLVFSLLVAKQQYELDPATKIEQFISEGNLVLVKDWKVTFEACDPSNFSNCEHVGEDYYDVTFPAPTHISKITESLEKEFGKKPNKAYMEANLPFSIKAWLKSQKSPVNLVIPTFVSTQVNLTLPYQSMGMTGRAQDVITNIPKSMANVGLIRLTAYFQVEANWFGPDSFSPALANWHVTKDYADIDQLNATSSHLNRMMEVLIPLLIAAMALIIDHSAGILLLAMYAGITALRSVVITYIEFSPSDNLSAFLSLLYGLTPFFLIKYSAFLAGVILPRLFYIALAIVGPLVTLLVFLSDSSLQVLKVQDMWVDGFASFFSAALIGTGFYLTYKAKHPDLSSNIAASKKTKIFVLMTAFLFLCIYAYANTMDIVEYYSTGSKSLLNWAHQILVPGLLFATFLDIGSIVNTIQRVSNIVREKSKLDRDIEIGKQLQSGILPDKKSTAQGWKWHAFYYPAAHLAGDWFDIREVNFKNKKVLAACVVDVTGHGISSAMMTANIASHWSLWCEELQNMDFPEDEVSKNEIIKTAPAQIHRGLIGLRYNLGCSLAVILYEPEERSLSYLTAGHPGVIVGENSSFQYLTTQGTRPGVKTDETLWSANTTLLSKESDTIILYTDGIVEFEKSVPVWLKHIRRDANKSKNNIKKYFTSQLRTNRKFYLNNPDKEDDLTLLIIKI